MDLDDLVLTAEQARVLGCLIEKSRTTPDDYPLTPNALMRACNQSTSREPVVNYDIGLVDQTAASMKPIGLVRFVHMATGRATTKYRHVVEERLGLSDRETAVIGLLLLRGPQTAGELKTRSERWSDFRDASEVLHTLSGLADRDRPLVRELARQPGHKETRWAHLLSGEPVMPVSSRLATTSAPPAAHRLGELQAEVAALRATVAQLAAWIINFDPSFSLVPTAPEPATAQDRLDDHERNPGNNSTEESESAVGADLATRPKSPAPGLDIYQR